MPFTKICNYCSQMKLSLMVSAYNVNVQSSVVAVSECYSIDRMYQLSSHNKVIRMFT